MKLRYGGFATKYLTPARPLRFFDLKHNTNFLTVVAVSGPHIEGTDAMVEPISLATGLLTLTGFALQASITLYQTVQSFQFHPKQIRDLKDELEALGGVLGTLTETVKATTNVDLSALNLPLLRCGNACKDFEQEIMKCSSRSGHRTSFRDWARLRYI